MNTQTLDAGTMAQVSHLRQAWMFVGAAFQADSEHCDSCSHNKIIGRITYEGGLHRAYVESASCTLGTGATDRPEQCPAYVAHLASDEGVTS